MSRPALRSPVATARPPSIRMSRLAVTAARLIVPVAWKRASEPTPCASDRPPTLIEPALMSMSEPVTSKVTPPGRPGPAKL